MFTHHVEVEAGESIDNYAKRLVSEALKRGERVEGYFNDVRLIVGPKSNPEVVAAYYLGYMDGRKSKKK